MRERGTLTLTHGLLCRPPTYSQSEKGRGGGGGGGGGVQYSV